MNMLKKILPLRITCTRLLETNGPTKLKKVVVEPLLDRELIRVHGEEVQQFLQGLTTNDICRLAKNSSMYTMFLNKSGRVLYDTIIYRPPHANNYIIECDKNVTNELKRHLRLYRVRRKIEIESIDSDLSPWVVFNPSETNVHHNLSPEEWFFTPDPRLKELGLRLLMTSNKTWTDLVKVFAKPGEVGINVPTSDCNYRLHRYIAGVGEGIVDLPPGKCFALESNADFLNGVSFQKGCYIGQELTARSYHTGVIRKRLMPLRLLKNAAEKGSSVQILNGASIGVLRDSYQNRGLALLRVEHALNYDAFMVDGETCYVDKPNWWPRELRYKASLAR